MEEKWSAAAWNVSHQLDQSTQLLLDWKASSTSSQSHPAFHADLESQLSSQIANISNDILSLESLLQQIESLPTAATNTNTNTKNYEAELLELSKQLDRLQAAFRPLSAASNPSAASHAANRSALLSNRSLAASSSSAATAASMLGTTTFSSSTPFRDTSADPFSDTYASNSNTNNPADDLTSGELVQLHERMMQDQDTHLDMLSETILRQKQIGLQIGNELDLHVDLLQQTDAHVGDVQERLGGVNRQMNQVVGRNSASSGDYKMNLIIIVLVVILVLIVFN